MYLPLIFGVFHNLQRMIFLFYICSFLVYCFSFISRDSFAPKTCPGVPAGPPPLINDYDDEEDDSWDTDVNARNKKIRFAQDDAEKKQRSEYGPGKDPESAISGNDNESYKLGLRNNPSSNKDDTPRVDSLQKRMLAMAGQDVDAYMKEMEEVHKQTQAEKERELHSRFVKPRSLYSFLIALNLRKILYTIK